MLNTKLKLKARLTRSAPRHAARRRSPTATPSETWAYSPGIAYLDAQEHIRDLLTRFLPKKHVRPAIAADQNKRTACSQKKTGSPGMDVVIVSRGLWLSAGDLLLWSRGYKSLPVPPVLVAEAGCCERSSLAGRMPAKPLHGRPFKPLPPPTQQRIDHPQRPAA